MHLSVSALWGGARTAAYSCCARGPPLTHSAAGHKRHPAALQGTHAPAASHHVTVSRYKAVLAPQPARHAGTDGLGTAHTAPKWLLNSLCRSSCANGWESGRDGCCCGPQCSDLFAFELPAVASGCSTARRKPVGRPSGSNVGVRGGRRGPASCTAQRFTWKDGVVLHGLGFPCLGCCKSWVGLTPPPPPQRKHQLHKHRLDAALLVLALLLCHR